MSQQEIHIGELNKFERYIGEINTDYINRFCSFNAVAKSYEYKESTDKFSPIGQDVKNFLYDTFGEKAIWYNDTIYYLTNHKSYDEEDINYGVINNDKMSFVSSFYNGSTYLEEMLGHLIRKHNF